MKNRKSIKNWLSRYIHKEEMGLYIWIGIWTILCVIGIITLAPAFGHILIAVGFGVMFWIVGVVGLMVASVTPF